MLEQYQSRLKSINEYSLTKDWDILIDSSIQQVIE